MTRTPRTHHVTGTRCAAQPHVRIVALVTIVLFVFAAATACALGPAAVAAPTPDSAPAELPPPPPVDAASWIVFDAGDDEVVAGHRIAEQRAIASLTKLMTALVVVERTDPDDKVEISAAAASTDEGSAVGMAAGQSYSVDVLLEALLVHSANDAAVALAEHVAGTQTEFVAEMNARAKRIGMRDTKFTTVHGLDHTPLTVSTPQDVVELARTALEERRIARAEAKREITIERPGAPPVTFRNRNGLLGSYDGVDSGKTGHTAQAGYNLLVHYGDDTGGDLFVAVFGSASEQARETQVRDLLDWGRQLRPKSVFATAGELLGTVPVAGSDEQLQLFVSKTMVARVRIGKPLRERIVVPAELEPPVRDGDEVGRYEIVADGRVVAQSPVYVHPGARKPTRRERARRVLERVDDVFLSGLREVGRQGDRFAEYWGLA